MREAVRNATTVGAAVKMLGGGSEIVAMVSTEWVWESEPKHSMCVDICICIFVYTHTYM